MRERGLKCRILQILFVLLMVAPHAGAWIEMEMQNHAIDAQMSLPMRERGLK